MSSKLDTKKLSEIHQKILKFNSERGWDPKFPDLAKSVVIEAAELLELFQWQSSIVDVSRMSAEFREKVSHEVADIIWYLFLFCDKLNLNLADVLVNKYEHNAKKYPAEKFQGHDNPDFYYQQKQLYRQNKK